MRTIFVCRLQLDATHLIVVTEADGTVHLSRPGLTSAQVRTWMEPQIPGVDYVPDRSPRNELANVMEEPCLRWQPRWDVGG